MRFVRLSLLCVLASVGLGGPAGAATCPGIRGGAPALSALPAAERLRFLQGELARAYRRSLAWSGGFGAAYGALSAGQLALLSVQTEREERIDLYVGAASAAVGLVAGAPTLVRLLRDRRAVAALSGGGCAALAAAEAALLRAARGDAFGKGLLTRAGNVVFNVGMGALLAGAFGHLTAAALNTVTGIIIGELMIETQPADSLDILARYRAGLLRGAPPPAPVLRLGLLAQRDAYGLTLSLSF